MNRRAAMGWQLVREAEDHAPASLTWRERFALAVLANAAMDSTRECPHGIEDNPDIIRRLRLSRSARYEVISALCDKGALVQLERGRNGVRAVYAVAPFSSLAYLKHPGNLDASPVDNPAKGPQNPDSSGNVRPMKGPGFTTEGSGKPGLKGPGNPDPIGDDRDFEETRTTLTRVREAILAAVPDATPDEMDETIRVIKTKFSPKNLPKYVETLVKRGDLIGLFPCGYGERKHSDRCRSRDCDNCTTSWCEGRCHSRTTKGARSA